jgi:hypothetical protein
MNVIDFEKGSCKRIQSNLDLYLNNELAAETTREVLRHLGGCPNCREAFEGRRRLKTVLKGAVLKDSAPPYLQERIKRSIRKDSSAGWARWMLIAAAMIALAAMAGGALQLIKRAETMQTEAIATGEANARLLKIGLDDHIHCAIDKGFANRVFSEEEIRKKLGPDFLGLVPAIKENAPVSYKIVVGHRCKLEGREFVHLILKSHYATLSMALTKKDGQSFVQDDAVAAVTPAAAAIYETHMEDLEVAGFETGDYLAFVISDLNQRDNLQIASALAHAVRGFFTKREA